MNNSETERVEKTFKDMGQNVQTPQRFLETPLGKVITIIANHWGDQFPELKNNETFKNQLKIWALLVLASYPDHAQRVTTAMRKTYQILQQAFRDANCTNHQCNYPLEKEWTFCPKCGTTKKPQDTT